MGGKAKGRADAYAAFSAIVDQEEISLFVRDDLRL
jgi:hypothetical protein